MAIGGRGWLPPGVEANAYADPYSDTPPVAGAPDLKESYALGADRPTAKIAVLAAMYGARSGAAGEALKGLERAYPVAMGVLDRAYADGVARLTAAGVLTALGMLLLAARTVWTALAS